MSRGSTRRRAVVFAAAAVLGSALTLVPSAAGAQETPPLGETDLVEIGTMVRPVDPLGRAMAVDEERNLGFVVDQDEGFALKLIDLEGMEEVGSAPPPTTLTRGVIPETGAALDGTRQWLFTARGYPGTPGACNPNLNINVYDYSVRSAGERVLDLDLIGGMPCSGPVNFYDVTNSYHQGSGRLYAMGLTTTEFWRNPFDISPVPALLGGNMKEDRGQMLLLRQLAIEGDGQCDYVQFSGCTNPDKSARAQATLEWEVDLRLAGCGRRRDLGGNSFDGWVRRHGNAVYAYCWDGRAHQSLSVGQQGYLVRIPLVEDADRNDPSRTVMRPETREAPSYDPVTGQITNYVAQRVPILPGEVTPILDPVSGRVLFVTTDEVNGNAVWVFDTEAMRFVGVVTGGDPDQPRGNTAVGFDSHRGRVYVLTQDGILVAHVRSDPLPSGIVYPVLQNTEGTEDFVTSTRISVAPKLGRLFVALNDYNDEVTTDHPDHYAVLEDRIPEPPEARDFDPDASTTQIDEVEGVTASSASGQAQASGARVVNTGGLPRAAGQNDPTCFYEPPNFDNLGKESQRPVPPWQLAPALLGSCGPELVASPGAREGALARTDLEAGSASGATARASVARTGTGDATDADVRRPSDCGADAPAETEAWGRRWPFPEGATTYMPFVDADTPLLARDGQDPGSASDKRPYEDQYNAARDAVWEGFFSHPQYEEGESRYRGGCDAAQDEVGTAGGADLRAGTQGRDGKGFPVPAATCTDFGEGASSEGFPQGGSEPLPVASSAAACDARGPFALARSHTGSALSLTLEGAPVVSVAQVASEVRSERTPEGQVTVASATATDVVVGPLRIAQVSSVATVKAKGRTGTASATLSRTLCGVRLEGVEIPEELEEPEGCLELEDPQDRARAQALFEEVNAALLQKVQLTLPQAQTQATPGGYQAVITKHPGQRGADQTVNDDDSHTVSALQVVLYNDGPRGRSRLVTQLAGVHAEARYGVTLLPTFSGFEGSFSAGSTSEASPGTRRVIPGTRRAPTAATVIEGQAFEELFSTAQPLPENPIRRFLGFLPEALGDLWRLFVQHPLEFLLLFFVFSLLGTPAYLAYRRRTFVGVVAG